jgi:hypothetical protein
VKETREQFKRIDSAFRPPPLLPQQEFPIGNEAGQDCRLKGFDQVSTMAWLALP